MKILFYQPGHTNQPWLDCLAAHLPRARIVPWSAETAGATPADADYALVWAAPPAFFAANRKFKAIFTLGAGVDALMKLPDLAVLTRGAPVIRLNDAGMAVQMAEYVCHALSRHIRGLARYETQQHDRQWKKWPAVARAAWPVGVMGLGAIGARVAQAVAGFDYPVFGWSQSAKSLAGVTTFAGAAALDAFLAETRALVCVLPLTPATESILNAANLAKLKPGGLVINVARGAHVVDSDLIAALDRGQLAGAVLDVFREEPLPAAHPFWCHPRITLTPHISATTLMEESVAQIAAKIAALERGESVDGVVDPGRGY